MYKNALATYQEVERETLSGRETEARILTKGAQKLQECQKNWDSDDRSKLLDEALRYNQRIWSIFQVELARDDNPLPKQLRSDLLRLSAFIDKRILETIAYPMAEKLTAVININRNIAAGLRQSVANP
ncbi:Flagellar FlaF family protein [uncultured Desulfobacterium sp.]|uniref:Flagellar FlaF family protein n=1 Tax=uncultured Desulfobacterium sp. TaxID=201089 RepID=A0A445MZH1_9BACT|nr:Flagellar FlaF family protein [uncultured Desulfobacterium sp.]